MDEDLKKLDRDALIGEVMRLSDTVRFEERRSVE